MRKYVTGTINVSNNDGVTSQV